MRHLLCESQLRALTEIAARTVEDAHYQVCRYPLLGIVTGLFR